MAELQATRDYWANKRKKSGHRAAFTAVTLCALGITAGVYANDFKETVDYTEYKPINGRLYKVGGLVKEHTLVSIGLWGVSGLSILGTFGCAMRAGNRYVSAHQHRSGQKDAFYIR